MSELIPSPPDSPKRAAARHALGLVEPGIAGDRGAVADLGDRGRMAGGAVAVDHQARIDLGDHRRVEGRRQQPADRIGADVPGDVPLHVGGGDAEIAQAARHQAPRMVAQDEVRRGAAGIVDAHRRRLVRLQ